MNEVAKAPEESPAAARARRKREAVASIKIGDRVTVDQWNVKCGVTEGVVVAENNSLVYPEKQVEGGGNTAVPLRVWYHYSVLSKHDNQQEAQYAGEPEVSDQ